MNKDLIAIFEYLEREKGIKREIVIAAIEDSLRAAARKSIKGIGEKVTVQINSKTGEIEVYTQKKIVEKVAKSQRRNLSRRRPRDGARMPGRPDDSKFPSLRKISAGSPPRQRARSSPKS